MNKYNIYIYIYTYICIYTCMYIYIYMYTYIAGALQRRHDAHGRAARALGDEPAEGGPVRESREPGIS